MAKILTDVDAFSADVTVPEDGDARNAASVEPAFQKLANRTRRNKNRLDALAGARTKLVPLEYCRPPDGYGVSPGVNLLSVELATASVWTFSANSNRLQIPIDLANGDILTNVNLCVSQGNAGASGQMSAKVYRQAISASAYATVLQLGSTLTFTVGAGFRSQSIAIAASNTIDNDLYRYHVMLLGSALAGTVSDFLHWAKLSYTAYGSP